MSWRPLKQLTLIFQRRQCHMDWWRFQVAIQFPIGKIFSDKSHCFLNADDHPICIWMQGIQWSNPAFATERSTAVAPCLTVWGAICWESQSLLIVSQGTLSTYKYVDTFCSLCYQVTQMPFIFKTMHCHIWRKSCNNIYKKYNIVTMPVRYPDLSSIEHIWEMLGRWLQSYQNTTEIVD